MGSLPMRQMRELWPPETLRCARAFLRATAGIGAVGSRVRGSGVRTGAALMDYTCGVCGTSVGWDANAPCPNCLRPEVFGGRTPRISKKYSLLAADFLANFIETSDSFRSAVKHFATWLDDSRAVETTCSVRPHDFCSAGTCAVCLDAARYHAIRAARVGSHGCCEIWNVAYVGRQLDEAMDAVMASNAVKTGREP